MWKSTSDDRQNRPKQCHHGGEVSTGIERYAEI
jgi:hypothetical protein